MDNKAYLKDQIKAVKRKMNAARLLDHGVLAAAAGGILGIICEVASFIWPIYYVHLTAVLCFAAGFLAGAVFALCRRVDMKQAARRLDSFGLKERMITAYEQIDNENELAQMLRQDARAHYEQLRGQIKIPLLPDKKHIMALCLAAAMVVVLGLLPSPVREQARLAHQVQEQAGEELEKLEEFLDSLQGVDMASLTEEQKALLQELTESLEMSREELTKAASWESLSALKERLDYKYGQAAQSLESLAGQTADPESAGIAAAFELAKAMADQDGSQTASTGTPGENAGSSSGEGDGSDQGDGTGEGNGSGEGDGTGEGNGSGQGDGSGEGNGSGQGDGSGEGNGSGQGDGFGEGNGSGQEDSSGEGEGSGQGTGRGTGSSDAAHDYVSIPNASGEDPTLTGEKSGDQDSDYYRQQNGLAWEGEHVDYSSVIGQYTEDAYEGIANGRYPSGMESVIRDYFENLNK